MSCDMAPCRMTGRTLGTLAGTQSFQDCQFDRSCISPRIIIVNEPSTHGMSPPRHVDMAWWHALGHLSAQARIIREIRIFFIPTCRAIKTVVFPVSFAVHLNKCQRIQLLNSTK